MVLPKPKILLGLLAASALLLGSGAQARNTYCCNDASGKRICGDMLPMACQKRAYRIVDGKGRVIREVEAPLTAEQRAQREAEAQRKREEAKRLAEQKRLDAALLATYRTEKEIDAARDRSLADFDKASGDSKKRLDSALKAKKKLDGEKEFYVKKPMPAHLKRQIEDNDEQIKTLQESIARRAAERDDLVEKFEEDRKRYMVLRYGKTAAESGPPAAPAAPAPAAAAPAADTKPAPAAPAADKSKR